MQAWGFPPVSNIALWANDAKTAGRTDGVASLP